MNSKRELLKHLEATPSFKEDMYSKSIIAGNN